MPTLITTSGAADANSYANVAEADLYHEGRLHDDAWDNVDDKEAALIWSTQVLNGLVVWTGAATDGIQRLSWPRNGMYTRNGYPIPNTEIPPDLKAAQCELARQLSVTDLTADNDVIKQDIRSLTAGSVSLSFGGVNHQYDYLGVWPDVTAVRLPDSVLILLVPSWYIRAGGDIENGPHNFMFETVDI